jgi:broad specificity phosphatase PhoE
MTTTVLLIRHGQTDWNASGRWQGHQDQPLNEIGRSQSAALAARLSTWGIRALYTSDLKRAHETASILGRALGLEPIADPAWRERFGGDFEGLSLAEMEANHAEALQALRAGAPPPGGESLPAVAARVTAAFESLLQNHQGEIVAVVSHGGALGSLIGSILGIPPGSHGGFSLAGNTGVTVVTAGERGRRVTLLNDSYHIDGNRPAV